MMNRSSERPTFDPTSEAIRDELSREVLSYAEGIRREMHVISRKYGVEKPADIGAKIESGEVSLADMDRMIELRKALEIAVATKRLPAVEVRRRETELNTFFWAIEDIARVHETANQFGGQSEDETKPLSWTPELEKAIEEMPPIPERFLFENRALMQKIIDLLKESLDGALRHDAGLIASMIMNRTMRQIDPRLLSGIKQTLQGGIDDYLRYQHDIGYQWSGGELTVIGRCGEGLGRAMTGGTIRARDVGVFAGVKMRGGTLEIGGTPAHDVGSDMFGGTIVIAVAGTSLGGEMNGGLIIAQSAGNSVGTKMHGGEIRVIAESGDFVGYQMDGGTISTRRAGVCAGVRMSDGNIRILETAASQVGDEMTGGTIEVGTSESAGTKMAGGTIRAGTVGRVGTDMKDGLIEVETGETVGTMMMGGKIVVTKHAGCVGKDTDGGEIVLRGTVREIGSSRRGGLVRFEGPLAWWKNLWVR